MHSVIYVAVLSHLTVWEDPITRPSAPSQGLAHRTVSNWDATNECQGRTGRPVILPVSTGTGKCLGLCFRHLLEAGGPPPASEGFCFPRGSRVPVNSLSLATAPPAGSLSASKVGGILGLGVPGPRRKSFKPHKQIGISSTSSKLYCTLLLDTSF